MTKSTITRERIQRIIRAINSEAYDEEEIRGWLSSDEIMELSRMALAAMDSSESVELPLDYLQGHKDGLEWAARLAEANHPETGDWLYDDPIELAKAIRKGPDMPPVQPVADSEPVIVVGDDGGDALSYRRLIQSFEPGTKLYRHAQPAPVVPEEAYSDDCPELYPSQPDAWAAGWNDCRAAMLQAKSMTSINPAPALVSLQKNAKSLTGNSPVIGIDLASGPDRTVEVRYVAPPGYVMVPMRLTAENGAKGALSGEFSETKFVNCPECFGDDECETCDGSGRIEITVPVTWTTIKEIWAKGVEHFAAAPQSPGSEPATVPGKWIPVSERMPFTIDDVEVFASVEVLVTDGKRVTVTDCNAGIRPASCNDFWCAFSEYGAMYPKVITYWQPLPEPPQEDKP